MDQTQLPVRVYNPRYLKAWQLPAQRIPLGIPGDYKPSLAMLPDGEIVMVALYNEPVGEGKIREWMPIWRSKDGGKTWSDREVAQDVIGREQWLTCTSDGTLFITSHFLSNDINNTDGCIHSYIHRSTDRGKSWERTKVMVTGEDRCGVPDDFGTHTSRNVVEMPDGRLLLGVSVGMWAEERGLPSNLAWLWESFDQGKTWQIPPNVKITGWYDNADGFFSEDFTYRTETGKLLHWIRVGPPSPMYPMRDHRCTPVSDDSGDRTMICESYDDGETWVNLRDFGDYGMHYIRILKLKDGRLLMTYTQRSLYHPFGLRAALSYDDGETWDLENDIMIIEGRTPWGCPWGTGFGNTLQLSDNSLLSAYTYFDWDDKSHLEVVRWGLE